MADEITIKVTQNHWNCLKLLKEVVDTLPSGDLKERAEAALDYLTRTFKGEAEPKVIVPCPPNRLIIT